MANLCVYEEIRLNTEQSEKFCQMSSSYSYDRLKNQPVSCALSTPLSKILFQGLFKKSLVSIYINSQEGCRCGNIMGHPVCIKWGTAI